MSDTTRAICLACSWRGPTAATGPIRFADLRRPRITLGEHRIARAALKERGVKAIDEQLIFDTIEQQRDLLKAAARETKAVRRRIERRDRSLAAPFDAEVADQGSALGADVLSELPPLAVEEWS